MTYKRLIVIGDANFRGDGSEWPELIPHLGPIPREFRPNLWTLEIKKAAPEDFPKLHKKFYEGLGKLVLSKKDTVLKLREKNNFGKLLADKLKTSYENYCSSTTNVTEILPTFKFNCNNSDFTDSLVILGVPPAVHNLTFNQKGEKLKNITINHIASQILLIKEFVENRKGRFLYMHTEDFPEQLYDIEHNPYLYDLMPLCLHSGNIQSMLTNSYYWKRYDGRFFEASVHKQIAQTLYNKVVSLQ